MSSPLDGVIVAACRVSWVRVRIILHSAPFISEMLECCLPFFDGWPSENAVELSKRMIYDGLSLVDGLFNAVINVVDICLNCRTFEVLQAFFPGLCCR